MNNKVKLHIVENTKGRCIIVDQDGRELDGVQWFKHCRGVDEIETIEVKLNALKDGVLVG